MCIGSRQWHSPPLRMCPIRGCGERRVPKNDVSKSRGRWRGHSKQSPQPFKMWPPTVEESLGRSANSGMLISSHPQPKLYRCQASSWTTSSTKAAMDLMLQRVHRGRAVKQPRVALHLGTTPRLMALEEILQNISQLVARPVIAVRQPAEQPNAEASLHNALDLKPVM